jgi:hypothetical protein
MKFEDEHTQKDELEKMLHKAIGRYRRVLEELVEL